jgi:hypothetical protein
MPGCTRPNFDLFRSLWFDVIHWVYAVFNS